jgi:hypothetical protein
MSCSKNNISYTEDTSPEWRKSMLKYLIRSLDKNKVLYLYGVTHAKKSDLRTVIVNNKNIDIIFFERLKMKKIFFRAVSFFIPTPLVFLIKIMNPELLEEILMGLDAESFHEILYFDRLFEQELIEYGLENKDVFDAEKIICQDDSYLLIGIDTDSLESNTGFMKKISYGVKIQKSLIWYL